MIFRNLFFAALVVGIISGITLGLVQQLAVVPTILAAEKYEVAEEEPAASPIQAVQAVTTATAHDHSTHDHGTSAQSEVAVTPVQEAHQATGHSHDPDAWAPEDGFERIAYTFGANILSAIGFALLLLSGMALAGKANIKTGALWGVAGYLSFFVAPAIGLHPEIPGMEAADIQGRQGWWLATVVMTAAGLGLIAFGHISLKLGGLVLLLIPHFLGAPLPETHGFAHPDAAAVAALEGLAHSFVQYTAIANGIFWLVVGISSGYFINKFGILTPEDKEVAPQTVA